MNGADVMLHDAQFLEGERPLAVDYGHATVQDAVALALECGISTLVLFHHSPVRSDDALDEIARWAPVLAPQLSLVVAREGDRLEVVPAVSRPVPRHEGEEVLAVGAQIRSR